MTFAHRESTCANAGESSIGRTEHAVRHPSKSVPHAGDGHGRRERDEVAPDGDVGGSDPGAVRGLQLERRVPRLAGRLLAAVDTAGRAAQVQAGGRGDGEGEGGLGRGRAQLQALQPRALVLHVLQVLHRPGRK